MSSIYLTKAIHEILPFEVISHTFTYIDPNDPENGLLPMKLSLVCSTWRDIALATARVWTRVHVQIPKSTVTKELLESIKKWIVRSRRLPCRLYLEFSLRRSNELPLTFLSDFIGPIASRLEALSLRVPARFLNGFFEINPFEFPLLESFTLKFPTDDNSPLIPLTSLPPTAFSASVSLQRLDLSTGTSRLGLFTPQTVFPWHTLTYLKINDLSISAYDALDVFCLSTNLVHCELTMPGWRTEDFANGVGINIRPSPSGSSPYQPLCIHPDLQVLRLDVSCGVIEPFFSRLSLPKLQDLRITMRSGFGWEDLDIALRDFCSRRPIQGLKRFEVYGISLKGNSGTEPIFQFLSRNPAIETLRLEHCGVFNHDFMTKFIAKPRNKFLPKLKHIYVVDTYQGDYYHGMEREQEFVDRYERHDWTNDQTILSVLQSRSVKPGARSGRTRTAALERAAFSHGPTYSTNFQSESKKLQRSGLRLSILENSQQVEEGTDGWLI
ncbi:hypothetical protein BDN72DRAFT_847432 [Pluteus cervinus]|uniref:Uncharacterized protein n=1 Tax=Pluteus cervinus TaxID=181527 RepID=A0ACD3AD87_9AGAR|nr:hypothetical protein BDN72DRAFT_847432 [Pluteus cervinus]